MFSAQQLQNCLLQFGISTKTDLFPKLSSAYNHPSRHYHSQQHIEHCLQQLHKFQHLAQHSAEIEIALWFHDAIYDTKKTNNEQQSAQWAEEFLLCHQVAQAKVDRVIGLILATQSHDQLTDSDQQLMIDIDLGILGQSEHAFLSYDADVRKEYHWVAVEAYRSGRLAVLRSFLQRDSIYHTPIFKDLYERQARRNLKAAINKLQSGSIN